MENNRLGSIGESLVRLEFKIDTLANLLLRVNSLPPSEIWQSLPDHEVCPFCESKITYKININEGYVSRECKCKTNLTSPINSMSGVNQ